MFKEDIFSGHCCQRVLCSRPQNTQVLVNAACLVANLAASEPTQVSRDMDKGVSPWGVILCEIVILRYSFSVFNHAASLPISPPLRFEFLNGRIPDCKWGLSKKSSVSSGLGFYWGWYGKVVLINIHLGRLWVTFHRAKSIALSVFTRLSFF